MRQNNFRKLSYPEIEMKKSEEVSTYYVLGLVREWIGFRHHLLKAPENKKMGP